MPLEAGKMNGEREPQSSVPRYTISCCAYKERSNCTSYVYSDTNMHEFVHMYAG